jgi:hypothetical protein
MCPINSEIFLFISSMYSLMYILNNKNREESLLKTNFYKYSKKILLE